MQIALTGGTGLIGTRLAQQLRSSGHEVLTFTRSPQPGDPTQVRWDPQARQIDAGAIDGIDAVVHLAGEPIAAKRWTDDQKQRILASRVDGTSLVAETIATSPNPPKRFLSGSAIGAYGHRGDEVLTESSDRGSGFLPSVVEQWESAAQPAIDSGASTAFLRTGIVLSDNGGALATQLPFFRFGLGGKSGSGKQFQSWIHLDDHVAAIEYLLTADIDGPVNLTAPTPVANAEFAKTLGSVLKRPTTIIPMFGPRLLFGRELADTLLLESQRVLPTRLSEAGFQFRFTELRAALEDLLR